MTDKRLRTEGAVLLVLSVVLTAVFILSVKMYDGIAAETAEGALAAFAETVRERIDENEAVSAFLGLTTEREAESDAVSGSAEETAAAKEAVEYIARYNSIYARLE